MTREYTNMNPHDALYTLTRDYPGGIEELARKMGMSLHVLRNKLAPHCTTHHVSWEELSEITDLLTAAGMKDAFRPMQAMNWRHGLIAHELPAVALTGGDDLVTTVCDAVSDLGGVAREVSDALKDKRIDAREMDAIEREFQSTLATICAWRERVRQRHLETDPARVK